MIHTIRRLVAAFAVLALVTAAGAADSRTSSDASGQFTIKARFVGVADAQA